MPDNWFFEDSWRAFNEANIERERARLKQEEMAARTKTDFKTVLKTANAPEEKPQ